MGLEVDVRRRRGFTLIEATFSVVIVAVVLCGALQALAVATRSGLQNKERSRAAELARELMGEIMQARYEEPNGTPVFGTEVGEKKIRAKWDDVDDYSEFADLKERDGLQKRDGTFMAGYKGWDRDVVVDWVTVANPNVSSATETGLKRIRVTVTTPTGRKCEFQSFRSKYSGYDRTPPATETTYPSWVGVTIQVGPDPACRATSGTNLLNMAP